MTPSALVILAGVLASASPSAPSVVVLVSGLRGVEAGGARELAESISGALSADGFEVALSPQAAVAQLRVSGAPDPVECEGKIDCVSVVARSFAPATAVAIQLGRVGRKVGVQIS